VQDEPIPVVRPVDFGTAKLMPDIDRARAWLLTVDGAPQSYVDLDDPCHLEFEYLRRIAYVVESGFDTPVDAVHLGGGALSLPRRLARTLPGARQDVVEADTGLAALVAEHLPTGEPGIRVHTADARAWLAGRPTASADVVIGDVFGGATVPAHVTSVEFAAEVVRVLRPDGVYAANLADAAPFAFLRSQLATFATQFEELVLIAEPAVLRGRRFGNAVLVAAHHPVDTAALARRTAADAFPARVEHGPGIRDFIAGARPVRDEDAVPSPEPPDGAFGIG